jgi:Flp pilus assembly protein TadG
MSREYAEGKSMYKLPDQPRFPSRSQRRSATETRVKHWIRRDDGSMTIFGMFVFFAMLLVAGIAIDAMRFEHERVRMQGATDRSVLAGTMLRQNISGATPEQLIRSFMEAEGLGPQVAGANQIYETPISGGRMMTVAPVASIPATFMRWFGIDQINIATPSTAMEALGRVDMEVVMVLDVTGSMGATTANGLTRIQNLRLAAADLATTLLGDDDREHGQVALSIVPYAEHVLPPPGFINHFVNLPATGGPCPDFVNWDSVTNSFDSQIIRRNCATHAWRTVRPYVDDLDNALEIINGLQASGTNLLNERYFRGLFPDIFGDSVVFPERPRSFELRATYAFGG